MRMARDEDAKAVTALTCLCFGDAYTTEEEISGFISFDENRLYVQYDEQGLAGAILFLAEDRQTMIDNLSIDPADYDRIRKDLRTLHHKFSVVRGDLRGRGLMTLMLEEALEEIRKEGRYGAIFVQAWIKQDVIPMERIFQRAGYVPYRRQIRPWWKYENRSCNICGGRCKCDAMVYYRTVETEQIQRNLPMKELMVEAKSENLGALLAFLNEQLQEIGCPKKVRIQIDVAVEEIFVNITNYAYGSDTGKVVVQFLYEREADRVEISFIDEGIPYDPLKKKDPDVSLPANQRSIGGLGIYMVKKTMDDLRYERKDNRNILTLVKLLSP